MTYELHLSSLPVNKDYSTLSFGMPITMASHRIRFRVMSMTLNAAFSITTSDDYLMVQVGTTTIRYGFTDSMRYEMDRVVYELNNVFSHPTYTDGTPDVGDSFVLSASYTALGTIRLTGSQAFRIIRMSHRVSLLMGLYDHVLPIQSTQLDPNTHAAPSAAAYPQLCYGNVLYLMAKTQGLSATNARGKPEVHSIVYKSIELLYPGFPVVCRTPGNYMGCSVDDLSSMSFQLVDYKLEPVVLHSPFHITIQMEPVYDSVGLIG